MTTKAVASSAILVLFCCNAVWAQWPNQTYGNRPTWEVEVGARIIDRPGSERNLPLVTDSVTLETLFNAEQATDLQVSGGVDFRFQKATNYDMSWEIKGYFNNWDSMESRAGALSAPAFTPTGLPAGSSLTAFDYAYDSELFNIELNFKRAVYPGLSLMAGPRFMNLEELVVVDANFFNPTLGDFLQVETRAETKNPLIGLGIGAEFRRPLTRDLFFIGSVKGGIFHNATTSQITVANTVLGIPGTTTTLIDDRETKGAGVGELSARLHYDISPGNVSLFAGYEAMWLDGVALAPAQILSASMPPAGPFINNQTTVFANGVVVGGMVRY